MEPQIKILLGRRSVCSGEGSSTNGVRQPAARSRHIPEGQVLLTSEVSDVRVGRMDSLMKECHGMEKRLKDGNLSNSFVLGGGQEIPQL